MQEDPLKPTLDSVTDMVVNSLSGAAREFYDREFTFFSNVTSISGKLKPFIKKTKPEKKASATLHHVFCANQAIIGEDRRGDGEDRGRSWRISAEQS